MSLSPAEMENRRAVKRIELYKALAKSFLYPTEEVYEYLHSPLYQQAFLEYAGLEDLQPELGNAIRGFVDVLGTWQDALHRASIEAEYNRLFAHLGSAKCPPYETEYGYENVFQKTEAMADIAGFYRAYGLEVTEPNAERVDFVATELEFMSYLLASEAYARANGVEEQTDIVIDTQKKFLRDHLGPWIVVFSKILLGNTENPFYRSLGAIVHQFAEAELALLGVHPGEVSRRTNPRNESLEPFGCDVCAAPSEIQQGERDRASSGFEV